MTRTFTTEQLEQARTKALANAERLVSDAALLLKNKRWPAALYFCQIAGEEIGKYLMVLSALVQIKSGRQVNWKRFWERFVSHREKQELVSYIEDVLLAVPSLQQSKSYYYSLKNQIAVLEKAKQISLYCDFFEGCFYEPNDIVTEHMAREAFIWIKNRVKLFGSAEKDFQKHKILDKLNPEVYKDITLK